MEPATPRHVVISGASKRLLEAAREEFPDTVSLIHPNEGFPEDVRDVLERNKTVTLHLGSSTFSIELMGVAKCYFPKIVRVANWRYLNFFLLWLADIMDIVQEIHIVFPNDAVEEKSDFARKEAIELVQETRALIADIKEPKADDDTAECRTPKRVVVDEVPGVQGILSEPQVSVPTFEAAADEPPSQAGHAAESSFSWANESVMLFAPPLPLPASPIARLPAARPESASYGPPSRPAAASAPPVQTSISLNVLAPPSQGMKIEKEQASPTRGKEKEKKSQRDWKKFSRKPSAVPASAPPAAAAPAPMPVSKKRKQFSEDKKLQRKKENEEEGYCEPVGKLAPGEGEDEDEAIDEAVSADTKRTLPKGEPTVWFVTTRPWKGTAMDDEADFIKYSHAPALMHAMQARVGKYWAAEKCVDVTTMDRSAEWLQDLSQDAARTIFVYIHGYSNTMQDSIKTAVELREALAKIGAQVNVVLFAWPARGGFFGAGAYDGDRKRVENPVNEEVFRTLLHHLAPVYNRTILMGHSMGNVLLMKSLAQMCRTEGSLNGKRAFRAVFSIAAAVHNSEWIAYARQYYVTTGRKVVLCCTSCDTALMGFTARHLDWPAGLLYRTPICSPSFHTLEVPPATAKSLDSKGHSYFTTRKLVMVMHNAMQTEPHAWAPHRLFGLTDPHARKAAGSWHTIDDEVKERPPEDEVMAEIVRLRQKVAALEAEVEILSGQRR